MFIPFMQLFEVSGDYLDDEWFSKYPPESIGLVLDPEISSWHSPTAVSSSTAPFGLCERNLA